MMAKVRCAQAYSKTDDLNAAYWGAGGCVDLMAESIFYDLRDLTNAGADRTGSVTASAWRLTPGG